MRLNPSHFSAVREASVGLLALWLPLFTLCSCSSSGTDGAGPGAESPAPGPDASQASEPPEFDNSAQVQGEPDDSSVPVPTPAAVDPESPVEEMPKDTPPAATGPASSDVAGGCSPTTVVDSVSNPFFALLRVTHVAQAVPSSAELWENSNLVVRGCMKEARAGRVIDFAEGAPNPIQTAVLEFAVVETLKTGSGGSGSPTGEAYVEFVRGGITVESLNEVIPSAPEMLLFLRPADGWDPETYQFIDQGAGLPAEAELLTFTASEGVVVETSSGLEHPLSDSPRTRLFSDDVHTLDELSDELRGL